MVKTINMKTRKVQKNVKEIDIKKKLEREIEDILSKQVTIKNESKNRSYPIKRNSIFRKDNGN